MKKLPTLEQLKAVFGNLPTPRNGYKLEVGVNKRFKEDDIFWQGDLTRRLWRNFKGADAGLTHRGLHLLEVKIEEPKVDFSQWSDEWDFEYMGMGWTSEKAEIYATLNSGGLLEFSTLLGIPLGVETLHYWKAAKKAKPTTRAEMFGEDHTKPVFLHYEGGESTSVRYMKTSKGESMLNGNTLKDIRDSEVRWSNHPDTEYEDANEFVV